MRLRGLGRIRRAAVALLPLCGFALSDQAAALPMLLGPASRETFSRNTSSKEPSAEDQEQGKQKTPEAAPAAPQKTATVESKDPRPLGFAGDLPLPAADGELLPLPDRWRTGFPDWPRYSRGRARDPYRQNVLKGDYPVLGQKTFLVLTALSDTIGELRRIPVPSDVSSQRPGSEEFFGRGEQGALIEQILLSFSLFHGDTSFLPRDWELRVTPVANFNILDTRENGIVNIDVRKGDRRTDQHLGFQEVFGEVRLFTVSPYYDFISLRVGIQGFTSDFRGFVFAENQLGARLFGNFGSNRFQWNLAAFDMLEKDTNSGLNTFERREQKVGVANFYIQDFIFLGYTTQFSLLYNEDEASRHFDRNNFLVRPGLIGDAAPHEIKVGYAGWTGEGHIGRLNISHAYYHAFGEDKRQPIAGRRTDVQADMAALELSFDVDWWRPVASVLWSSGDADPLDDRAKGFSAIFDNPKFAGGPFSFWNRQGIPLTQTGVKLVNPNSLLPDLKSSKEEGQANYINPGLFLYGLFFEFKLTPKLVLDVNVNYVRFHHTETLEHLLFQPEIHREIGLDYGLGIKWRPFLNQQAVIVLGAAGFRPGKGFKDIFSSICQQPCGAKSKHLYQAFASLAFAY